MIMVLKIATMEKGNIKEMMIMEKKNKMLMKLMNAETRGP